MNNSLKRSVAQTMRTLPISALVASSLCGPAFAAGRPATPYHFLSPVTSAQTSKHRVLDFKGQHIVIGSAEAKTRKFQQDNPCVTPAKPLFVADPAMNAVLIYDAAANGVGVLPVCVLGGATTQLNGPVAATTGTELGQPYLWVSDGGNDTITYYTLPITSTTQAPVATISWNGSPLCSSGEQSGNNPLQFAYGMVHLHFPTTQTYGAILETSENPQDANNDFYLYTWQPNASGPSSCTLSASNNTFTSPSGPSQYLPPVSTGYWPQIFNANATSVSRIFVSQTSGWAWSPNDSWTIGPGACTEGTAMQQGTQTGGADSFVFVTTNHGCNYPATDALWSCSVANFPGSCPANPVCINTTQNNTNARLDFPDFPGVSASKHRLYVPNQNNGTITSYKLTGGGGLVCKPKAVYIGATHPVGVALQY